jgi:hypothetical protein
MASLRATGKCPETIVTYPFWLPSTILFLWATGVDSKFSCVSVKIGVSCEFVQIWGYYQLFKATMMEHVVDGFKE